MKKLLLVLLLVAGSTRAERAYLYDLGPEVKVGQEVKRQFPVTLFLETPCSLPLVNAENFRHYAAYRGVWDIGCWAPTIDGRAVIVVPGQPVETVLLSVMPMAEISKDGKKTVITDRPAYLKQLQP